jgi:hypothetical protein
MKEHPSPELEKARNIYKATGARVWTIVLSLVEAAGRAAGWSSDFGQSVVSVVLRTLSLRRTLRSRLLLPDENLSFPAADLLPMTMSTEELRFDPACRAHVKKTRPQRR